MFHGELFVEALVDEINDFVFAFELGALGLHAGVSNIGVRNTVIDPPDDELVQVAVEPAHDLLNDPMQLGKRDIAPDLEPPPDRGPAVFECDFQSRRLRISEDYTLSNTLT